MADKLIEECTENVKLAKITLGVNENRHKWSSYTLHVVLFLTILTANIGISTYFIYFNWYLKKMLFMLPLVPILTQQFNELRNGKSQTKRDQKSNFIFTTTYLILKILIQAY